MAFPRARLELTETALVDARHAPVAKLHALRNLGVRIAIDDFGTGYSSLSRLKQFPIHSIKIDQSFVAGLGSDSDDDAIVAATLAMASTLGLAVIAEVFESLPLVAKPPGVRNVHDRSHFDREGPVRHGEVVVLPDLRKAAAVERDHVAWLRGKIVRVLASPAGRRLLMLRWAISQRP